MTNFTPGYDDKDSVRDGYPKFESNLQVFFDKAIDGNKPLFTTNVEDLYELYLSNLPENARQHYTCHGCRNFINRYGNLVTINADGGVESAIWDEASTPTFFIPTVQAMKQAVLNAKVNGVFIPDARVLGTPKTGEWTHLAIRLPQEMTNKSVLRNSFQAMAEKRESFNVLARSLEEFSFEDATKAFALVRDGGLYRSDTVMGIARFFKGLKEKLEATSSGDQKRNLMWLAIANNPPGITHVRGSKFGQIILSGIKDGLSTRTIQAQFEEVMNPATHGRSQRGPSANAIADAERVFKKLAEAGIATEESLQRRYATIEEIPLSIYQAQEYVEKKEEKAAGVFGHLAPLAKPAADSVVLPSSVMTWEKFQRTVLPEAKEIEVLADNPNRFMALVTAAHPHAPNILQWDNPFSWYYHGGIDGEIKRRVEEAGGRYQDNEIRASLIWESYTDLDFHVVTPLGEHIYYGSKRDRLGGFLDVDMNAGSGKTMKPVENIRWANNAPEGRYRFYVHNYSDRNHKNNPYKVELEIGGKIFSVNGLATGTDYTQDVFVFDYVRGQEPRMLTSNHTVEDAWGVQANDFVKVKGITTSPNLWSENPKPAAGTHVFFLLEDVKDEKEGVGRGFFNETLKPELREIRRTLELFTANTPIQGADEATACGVGYTKDGEWNLTVRVKTNDSTRIIKIDRWD